MVVTFDVDEFIADCIAARRETDALRAVREVLDRALAQPDEIDRVLPATAAEFQPLYTPDISIFKFVWGPGRGHTARDTSLADSLTRL